MKLQLKRLGNGRQCAAPALTLWNCVCICATLSAWGSTHPVSQNQIFRPDRKIETGGFFSSINSRKWQENVIVL